MLNSSLTTYIRNILGYLSTRYAIWRIKPTYEEKRSYNKTDRILLTFDDFADEKSITSILKILKTYKVKAIFFLVGDWANTHAKLVNWIKQDGHWIGNHTKTHANLLKLTNEEVVKEIKGGPSSTLLRPPFGRYNKRIRTIAKNLGYKICYWDIDTDDWKEIKNSLIKERIFNNLHNGACILMHLHAKNTLEILPDIIKEIRNKGYEMCYEGNEIDYD